MQSPPPMLCRMHCRRRHSERLASLINDACNIGSGDNDVVVPVPLTTPPLTRSMVVAASSSASSSSHRRGEVGVEERYLSAMPQWWYHDDGRCTPPPTLFRCSSAAGWIGYQCLPPSCSIVPLCVSNYKLPLPADHEEAEGV